MPTPPDFQVGQLATAAQMNQIGLWLVKTQTVGSGVSSVTVTDAFSADYENYRVIISGGTASSGDNMSLQLTGSTGATYSTTGMFTSYGASTVSGYGSPVTTSWLVGYFGAVFTSVSMDIYSPYAATQSRMTTTSSSGYNYYFTGQNTSTAQSPGFTLTISSGTFTGQKIRVYGYRN